MDRERWRDTYDAWKTHNPADDDEEEEEEELDPDLLYEDWLERARNEK